MLVTASTPGNLSVLERLQLMEDSRLVRSYFGVRKVVELQ
jgi:hypothetical protein